MSEGAERCKLPQWGLRFGANTANATHSRAQGAFLLVVIVSMATEAGYILNTNTLVVTKKQVNLQWQVSESH